MELRPGEPECLMTAKVRTIGIDSFDTTGFKLQTDIFERDLIAFL